MLFNKYTRNYFTYVLLIVIILSGSLLSACGAATPNEESPTETAAPTIVETKTEEVLEVIIPTTIAPIDTVATQKPTYEWTVDPEVTNYHLQVFEGKTKKFARVFPVSDCEATNCNISPATWVLADGNYRWRVRAKVGGEWQPFTEFTSFSVAAPSE